MTYFKKYRTLYLYYSEKVNYFRTSNNIRFKGLSEIYSQNLAARLLSETNFESAWGSAHIKEKMEQQLCKSQKKPRLKVYHKKP